MKYRVLWAPDAEHELDAILASAADQTKLVSAARYVDGFLLTDPISFGESRYDNIRIGFVLPLGVEYEILDDVRTVIVHGVWRIGSR